MADGQFTSLVSKDRDANALANTIYVQISDETTALAIDGSGYITANINGSVTVTASDLDIRNLSETTDQVLVFANTAKDGTGTDYVPLVDADGKLIISNPGGTSYVEDVAAAQPATGSASLVERDDVLAGITPAEGDWSKLYCSANGALWVTVDGTVAATQSGVWDIGTVTTLTTITNDVNIADGGNSITVDAINLDIRDLNLTDDAVKVSANATANSELNPIYVYNTAAVVSGEEVHDYDTAVAVASDASDTHEYAVSGTTFLLKSVIVSGSGNIKFEVQFGPTAGVATVAVGFLTGRQGDTKQITFDPAVECPSASTGVVRIVRTNRQGAATDLYSTIIGSDIA